MKEGKGEESGVDSKHQEFYESLLKKDAQEVKDEIAKKVQKKERKKSKT